jgi:hypothetical protein
MTVAATSRMGDIITLLWYMDMPASRAAFERNGTISSLEIKDAPSAPNE